MEKKNYERPVMEVIRMEQEDVIRTSDPNGNSISSTSLDAF
ncbi:MAG: hypothetical protein Q4C66_05865 [Lachnospiraceae bacterium]|nr:hypothetical protein [Lachnospiraceae bacterium]